MNKSSDGTKEGTKRKPLCVLIVMDGFGIRSDQYGNAILKAQTPNLDALWSSCPHALLKASGNEVGLPRGNPGNSEVGHLNMGAGQIVYQNLARINDSIRTGEFAKIPNLIKAFKEVKKRKVKLHLMGILSAGGVHGHIEHLFEIMKICKDRKVEPYVHVFLDGMDTDSKDGYIYLSMLNAKIRDLGVGKIASISGRFYAMDRNFRWERTKEAYNAMLGFGKRTATESMDILQKAYGEGEDDFLFTPTTMVDTEGKPVGAIESNDIVIFYNYREDRARQITQAFVLEENWKGFERKNRPENIYFLTMTGYEENLPVQILFEPHYIETTVASVVSEAGYTQLHMAETEKSAHVSYFFNGGREAPHKGEEFFSIPSPKVKSYAETPAMSAEIVRDEAVYRIELGKYNFVLINFANPDMLGHTGVFDATVEAIELIDKCVRDVAESTINSGGCIIITGDHGNPDVMIDELTGSVDTAHTLNSVPLIIAHGLKEFPLCKNPRKIGTGEGAEEKGILADVGVTVLTLMGLQPTEEMTGMDLFPFITGSDPT